MPSLLRLPQGFISPYDLLDAIHHRKNGRWFPEATAERATDLAEQYGSKALAVLFLAPQSLDAYEASERFRFIADELRLAEIRCWWRPSDHLDANENLAILAMIWADEAEHPYLHDLAAFAGLGAFLAHRAAERAVEEVRIGPYPSGVAVLVRFAYTARALRDRTVNLWDALLQAERGRLLLFEDEWAKRHVARLMRREVPIEAA